MLTCHCFVDRCYTFVVGKLNPNKLANFPEIDVFVAVACPENSIINDKEFFRPVITPYEFEVNNVLESRCKHSLKMFVFTSGCR